MSSIVEAQASGDQSLPIGMQHYAWLKNMSTFANWERRTVAGARGSNHRRRLLQQELNAQVSR